MNTLKNRIQSYILLLGVLYPDDTKEIVYHSMFCKTVCSEILCPAFGVKENWNVVKTVDIYRKIKSERLKILKMSYEK